METTMKTLIKSVIVALGLAGASMATMAVTGTPANAASSFGFYFGPDGARIGYSEGSYYDRYGYRHYYRYPRDWRRYHRPLGWYQSHPYWYRDRDWYYDRY
jgi:hypothetical protein